MSRMGDDNLQSACAVCDRPDNAEDMVACDSCGSWYHFSCANVDESVADRSWNCTSCGSAARAQSQKAGPQTLTVPSNAGKSSKTSDVNKSNTGKKSTAKGSVSVASSVKDKAIQIELKMLEEQERIKEQELIEEKEIRQRKLQLERQMKERELALEAKRLAEEKAFEEKQLADEEKFRKAQSKMRQQSLEKMNSLVRQLSQRGSDTSSVCQSEAAKSVEKVNLWLQQSDKQTGGENKKPVDNVLERNSGKLVNTDASRPKRDHIRRSIQKPKEPGRTKDDDSQYSNAQAEIPPTSRQLAARQVMGKDLPVFSGNPEEWPIWISNFERSTVTCGFSQDENLMRLQRCLKGPALEMVRSRLLCPTSVPYVIKILQLRYGRPETLIKTLIERIHRLPPLNTDSLESIVDFGIAVDNLVEHLKTAKQQSHLMNPSLLHELVGKLPVDYRMKWSAYKSPFAEVDLGTFGAFTSSLVKLAFEVMDDTPTGTTSKGTYQKPKDRGFVQAHSEQPTAGPSSANSNTVAYLKQSNKYCIFCQIEGHRVADCFKFQALNIDERCEVVSQNSLCWMCLNQHGNWPCKTWQGCGIEGCRLRHHKLLHATTPSVNREVSTSHTAQQTTGAPLFRILPVTLYGERCQVEVYAFVDEGSQVTLLDEAVAVEMGISGPVEKLNLQWTGNVTRNEPNSKRIRMEISGSGSTERYAQFNVRTVASLDLPMQSLRYHELANNHSHLRGLPIENGRDITPKLLIGLDNLKLTVPLKIRQGGWDQPIAAKCRLGWSIYGCIQPVSESFTCGFHVGGWTNSKLDLNQEKGHTRQVTKVARRKADVLESNRRHNSSAQLAKNDELDKAMVHSAEVRYRFPLDGILTKAIPCQKSQQLQWKGRRQDAIHQLWRYKANGNAPKVRTTRNCRATFFNRRKNKFHQHDSQFKNEPDVRMLEMKKEERTRIEEVLVGPDDRVRQTWACTKGGVARRPVVKLTLFDVRMDGDPEQGDCNGSRAGECDGE